ncbi:MAG: L-seryl-tRNA(Sec) selenium transferase [Lachnospiraceae bacterium]
MDKKQLYRQIPKVDALLEQEVIQEMIQHYNRNTVVEAIRVETEELRAYIGQCEDEAQAQKRMDDLLGRIEAAVIKVNTPNIKTVINGTGTILHTNLGRAPIGKSQMDYIYGIATNYSNLEYNLEAGKRGERYSHFESLLCRITGAEAAIAVNNNAAAVMLILSTMAKGGEVIVSRGELVEIGGKFRIPDVMEQSGATLVEVGTTNKTHRDDYEQAVTADTIAFLKVHTSNYRIVGFTENVSVAEMVKIGEKHNLPVIEDLGSGVLIDLEKYGLTHEPTVQESIKNGADVVCFSGDKLLGGPQAGIIVGKKKYIEKMKKNQLMRALRIDKFTAATLDVVLQEYLSEEKAIVNIPVLQMITQPLDAVKKKAQTLQRMMKRANFHAEMKVESCESQIGGGSLPLERIPSMAVTLKPISISTSELEERMRYLPVPIIVRTTEDKVWIDMRTVGEQWMQVIVKELKESNLFQPTWLYEKR